MNENKDFISMSESMREHLKNYMENEITSIDDFLGHFIYNQDLGGAEQVDWDNYYAGAEAPLRNSELKQTVLSYLIKMLDKECQRKEDCHA